MFVDFLFSSFPFFQQQVNFCIETLHFLFGKRIGSCFYKVIPLFDCKRDVLFQLCCLGMVWIIVRDFLKISFQVLVAFNVGKAEPFVIVDFIMVMLNCSFRP